MPIIVGLIVRRMKDKIYAETAQFDVSVGDRVLLETEHGQESGLVCEKEKMVDKFKEDVATLADEIGK